MLEGTEATVVAELVSDYQPNNHATNEGMRRQKTKRTGGGQIF